MSVNKIKQLRWYLNMKDKIKSINIDIEGQLDNFH